MPLDRFSAPLKPTLLLSGGAHGHRVECVSTQAVHSSKLMPLQATVDFCDIKGFPGWLVASSWTCRQALALYHNCTIVLTAWACMLCHTAVTKLGHRQQCSNQRHDSCSKNSEHSSGERFVLMCYGLGVKPKFVNMSNKVPLPAVLGRDRTEHGV